MILVDTSVWIDFFNGQVTPKTDALDDLLGREPILIGDLILTEILQGFRRDADYRKARTLLETLELRTLGGRQIAIAAADNYRTLRRRGITPRKTIDMVIGAYCLVHGLQLLHADRGFDVLKRNGAPRHQGVKFVRNSCGVIANHFPLVTTPSVQAQRRLDRRDPIAAGKLACQPFAVEVIDDCDQSTLQGQVALP
jgi:predicted nucleic acid-binding protein